jgi:hypothetical protein
MNKRRRHGGRGLNARNPSAMSPTSLYRGRYSRIEEYELKVSIALKLTCRYGAQHNSGEVQRLSNLLYDAMNNL